MEINKKDMIQMVEFCKAQLKTIGIEVGEIADVEINTKKKTCYGQCSRSRITGKYTIRMMTHLNSFRTPQEVQNTVMHELLHTLPNCLNHSPLWKAQASKVNRLLGYNITTRSALTEDMVQERQKVAPWALKCECCGVIVATYERKPKDKKNSYHKACGVQGIGKLTLIKQ